MADLKVIRKPEWATITMQSKKGAQFWIVIMEVCGTNAIPYDLLPDILNMAKMKGLTWSEVFQGSDEARAKGGA